MIKHETASRLWIAIGYLGSTLIIILSLVPGSARPHSGVGGNYEHGIAYALVGFAFAMGYRAIRERLLSGLALAVGAAILELLQNFIPGRNPEVAGFVASTTGAWLGLAVAIFAAAVLRSIAK